MKMTKSTMSQEWQRRLGYAAYAYLVELPTGADPRGSSSMPAMHPRCLSDCLSVTLLMDCPTCPSVQLQLATHSESLARLRMDSLSASFSRLSAMKDRKDSDSLELSACRLQQYRYPAHLQLASCSGHCVLVVGQNANGHSFNASN